MIALLSATLIVTCMCALLIGMAEIAGGFMGDSSMVPGIIVLGVVAMIILFSIGLMTGEFVLTIGGS